MKAHHRWAALRRIGLCLTMGCLIPTTAIAQETRAVSTKQEAAIEVAQARVLPQWVKPAELKVALGVVQQIRQAKTEAALEQWRNLVRQLGKTHPIDEIDSVSRWILREALLSPHAELAQKAFKVGEARKLTVAIAAYQRELRAAAAKSSAAGSAKTEVAVKAVENGRLVTKGFQPLTAGQIQAQIQAAESQRLTTAENTKLAMMGLQTAAQQRQRALELIAAIMKTQHDTALAVIQNMK